MAIPKSFIEQLLLHCEIEDVISSYVNIGRTGRNKKGLCPFHSEKTPSFTVYPDTQSYFCFGCGAGGDVISFIMRAENMDYVEAVHFLAKRVGLTVPDDMEHDRTSQLKAKILEINRETARFYYRCLKSPQGKAGYDYLKGRQLSDEMIKKYGLGYAPEGWNHLRNHLRKKGFSYEDMQAACVVVKGRNDSVYDQFRNRVMFPIIDSRGNVIAFGGRVLDDSKPKYLNSPDTPVFKKSRNLFSLNFARKADLSRVILAEGYMDVIAIHAAGFENVVATLGTALTPEQARMLAKLTGEIVIAYDSDAAGQAATHRAKNLLSEVGITTKVLAMSGAKDPDEYIKKYGARRFELLLEGANDIIKHELGQLKSGYDFEEPDQLNEYLRRAIALVSEMQKPLEREVYAGIIVKDTGISKDRVLSEVEAAWKRRKKQQEKREWNDIQSNKQVMTDRINPQKSRFLVEATAEERIIAAILRNPDYIPHLLSKIEVDDFATDFDKKVLGRIISLFQVNNEIVLTDLVPYFTQEEFAKISGMLARTAELHLNRQELEECMQTLLKHKNSLKTIDITNMTPEQLEQIRRNKQQK